LSFSFLKDRDNYLEIEHHNIDFEAVEKFYNVLENIFGEEKVVAMYLDASKTFFRNMKDDEKEIEEPWIFRSMFIMMHNP